MLSGPICGHADETAYFTDADQLPTPTNGQRFFAKDSVSPFPAREPKRMLVDLHAHVFEHGLGILSSGNFGDNQLLASWNSIFGNKVNPEALEASGLGLVVVALYAHPILSLGTKESLRKQLKMVQDFIKAHPNWVIARNAAEAQAAYARGKRVIVLSLEGAGGVLETEGDIHEFVDRAGISIVTFAHLTDDALSRSAIMKGGQKMANPLAVIDASMKGPRGCYDELLNPNDFPIKGVAIAQLLINRGVWIDLAHSSDRLTKTLIPMIEKAGQPLLYSHTAMREYDKAERYISRALLDEVAKSGGIVGLTPTESIVGDTTVLEKNCPKECNGKCKGGIFAVGAQFDAIAATVGAKHVFFGSDFNGAIDQLKPSSCSLGSTIDRQGFSNIGQTAELWQDVAHVSRAAAENNQNGVENFISVWARVKAAP